AIDARRQIGQREDAAKQEQTELDGVGPNDRFDAADVGVKQGEDDEEQDGAEDGIARAEAEQAVAQHQFDGGAGDVDAHAGGEGFADQEKGAGGLAGAGAERVGEELVGRIDLAFEIMRYQENRQQDAGDHITDDHLQERDVAAIRHRRHANDGQRAGFG